MQVNKHYKIPWSKGQKPTNDHLNTCRKHIYIGNSEDSTKHPLEPINKFSKVAGYKINTQKSVVLPYTMGELSEKEFKEAIIFSITIKTKQQNT